MTNELLWIKDWYWAHRDAVRVVMAVGAVAVFQIGLLLWTFRRLSELSHIRERMSRLADGLALLADTTESGLATLIREVEQIGKRRTPAPRSAPRAAVSKRVVAAHLSGDRIPDIAEAESLSESEVRLHLALAEAARRDANLGLRDSGLRP